MESYDPTKSLAKLKVDEIEGPMLEDGSTSELKMCSVDHMIEIEMNKLTQKRINTNRIPELFVLVPCSLADHKPEPGGKGYFVIRGNKLMDISRGQLEQKSENLLSCTQGCGYENCCNTALDSLKEDINLPDMVSCSVKMPTHMVSLTDFCEAHEETNFPVLITSNLQDVTAQFKKVAKIIIQKASYRIPFAFNDSFCLLNSSSPKNPVFALSANSVLQWANLINNREQFLQAEFNHMPHQLKLILMDLHSVILTNSPVLFNLQVDHELEYLTNVSDIRVKNRRLRGYKRKLEEHVVDLKDAKRFKSRTYDDKKWFTGKKVSQDEDTKAGIGPLFTDMTLSCKSYEVTLMQDKSFKKYQDVENIKTEATKSWDQNFNCLACKKSHKVFDMDLGLNLVISDQHFPAIVPCYRKSTVAVARFCNFTLHNLYRHILYPILKAEGNAVSNDRFGATDLIQYCISRGIKVTLMICSGTSLARDGPAGYTQAMQEIQFMTCDRTLTNGDRNLLIQSVIYPAPLIPAVLPSKNSDSMALILSKYKVEATNMARVACLRGSESKVMFISNTEFVQIEPTGVQDNTSLRESLDYSFLSGLKIYPQNKVHMEMKILKLPTMVLLPNESRSTVEGMLKPGVLAEYSMAIHNDFNQVCLLLFLTQFLKA